MNGFYVYLPSNVKSIYFENTAANFKTKLAQYCNLSANYEVGLAEISYTYSYLNIIEDEIITIMYLDSKYYTILKRVKLKKGYYTIENLISSLNNIIQLDISYISLPRFELFDVRNHQKVKLIYGKQKNSPIFLKISYNLAHILGISKNVMDEVSNHILTLIFYDFEESDEIKDLEKYNFEIPSELDAQNTFDISGGFHTIFIYSDIIKTNLVGDSQTQLLRFVEIPNHSSYGDQVHLIFDNIQYFSLVTNEFESIEIAIKDDTGENMPFNYAKNIIVLHFRKKDNKRDENKEKNTNVFLNEQSISQLL